MRQKKKFLETETNQVKKNFLCVAENNITENKQYFSS